MNLVPLAGVVLLTAVPLLALAVGYRRRHRDRPVPGMLYLGVLDSMRCRQLLRGLAEDRALTARRRRTARRIHRLLRALSLPATVLRRRTVPVPALLARRMLTLLGHYPAAGTADARQARALSVLLDVELGTRHP